MKGIRLSLALGATVLAVLALGSAAASAAPVSLAAIGATYTQNFDTLASTGTSSAVPDGWAFRETGTNANGVYTAGTGSSNAGDTYSFGAAGSTDRAFGGLQSGSLVPFIGAQFENDTGKTITSLDIAYFGEQWRLGATGRGADRLDFVYSLDATSLADGAWTQVDGLGFSSPVQTGSVGALNGNANRVAVSGSVSGLSVAPGASFWIGWRDFNVTGSDDGLAVDDFSLTPHTAADLQVIVHCGAAITTTQGFAGSGPVSASDGDDVVTDIHLVSPPAGISLTGFSPASSRGGTATATVSVADTTAPGAYDVVVEAANDALPAQTGSCTQHVDVSRVMTIGEVQGSVSDTADGATFPSPYVGKTVTVRGVVTEKTYASGNGFYLQNTPGTADGDPTSSDGIYVYLGGYTTLIGGYTPELGDEIVMSGRVSEYYNQTELGSARFVALVGHGVLVTPFSASPPAEAADAARYWERHEGELAQLDTGSTVDSPIHLYASNGDTEFYALAPNSPVSGRTDPYARRAFRPAHPLAGAGEARVLVTSGGVAAHGQLLAPVHVFETFTAPLVGAVTYDYSKYSLEASAQPEVAPGPDPYDNAPPAVFDRGKAYSIVNYNLENLYDYVDDPTDGCDFAGNGGCTGVTPPFDYVPASEAAYKARIDEIAHQIVSYLHGPDVLAVQEVEDEDLNNDGQPDPLEDLEAAITAIGGPSYHAGYDRDGADARGIVSAFLWRTDRVELLPAIHAPAIDYRGEPLPMNGDVSNPLALNAVLPPDATAGADGANVFSRAAELAHFRIWRTAVGRSEYRDVWLVANHFSSGPDTRVAQRREQAAYNAAIAKAIEADDPAARIDVLGDLNVYPRPDDPFSPLSDQLAPLYDAGLHNLYDTVLAQHPSSAYSYVYQGLAQTLDQQFVSPGLFADLKAVNEAHFNSDWTPDVENDAWHGTSDHDPTVARFDGRATLAGLRQLVLHYAETGQLNAHAEKGLLDRLDRAASFQASGQQNPYANQLHSFAQDATHGVPGEIDPAAGEALAAEAAAVLAG